MAEKTSLSLSMTDAGGNKLSKAVTDVNPNASNAALNAFSRELLTEHLKGCVARDLREGRDETVDELVAVLQKLMK